MTERLIHNEPTVVTKYLHFFRQITFIQFPSDNTYILIIYWFGCRVWNVITAPPIEPMFVNIGFAKLWRPHQKYVFTFILTRVVFCRVTYVGFFRCDKLKPKAMVFNKGSTKFLTPHVKTNHRQLFQRQQNI